MPTTDPAHTRAAILRNARAAENERLRNLAIRRWGPLDEAELDARVAELVREKGAVGGRKGGAATRQRVAVARRLAETQPEMLAHVHVLREQLDALVHLITGMCAHDWPGDLDDPEAACRYCGLLYGEWSAIRSGAAA